MRSRLDIDGTIALERSRVLDYLTLTKPELTLLSVLTALAGFLLGLEGKIPSWVLLHTLVGTALVGGGAGALNQYIERQYDAMMKRTESRPLPSGRIAPWEALLFGSTLTLAGIADLVFFVNALTGLLAGITSATYLFLYTPLKRITPASTLIGAIPGALPPVMGWTAARNGIGIEAWVLFAILFVWQMPHFLSLAWMYRKDYAHAGYKLLTVADPEGVVTSRHILFYCALLIPVSAAQGWVSHLGVTYAVCSLMLGGGFFFLSLLLFRSRTDGAARRLFLSSLAYLPVLLLVMALDKLH